MLNTSEDYVRAWCSDPENCSMRHLGMLDYAQEDAPFGSECRWDADEDVDLPDAADYESLVF